MIKTNLYPIVEGIRGRLGPLVFRRVGGRTVVQRAPDMSRVVASPAQLAQRERFRQAAAHGRAVLANPVLRALHTERAQRRGLTVFALCVADYLRSPGARASGPLSRNDSV